MPTNSPREACIDLDGELLDHCPKDNVARKCVVSSNGIKLQNVYYYNNIDQNLPCIKGDDGKIIQKTKRSPVE